MIISLLCHWKQKEKLSQVIDSNWSYHLPKKDIKRERALDPLILGLAGCGGGDGCGVTSLFVKWVWVNRTHREIYTKDTVYVKGSDSNIPILLLTHSGDQTTPHPYADLLSPGPLKSR